MSDIWRRPKKLVFAVHEYGKNPVIYQRDAARALNFCRGLDADSRGALASLIDLMAVHRGMVPAYPCTYIAGMIGITERQWQSGIERKLVSARKIKRVIVATIEYWTLTDPDIIVAYAPLPRRAASGNAGAVVVLDRHEDDVEAEAIEVEADAPAPSPAIWVPETPSPPPPAPDIQDMEPIGPGDEDVPPAPPPGPDDDDPDLIDDGAPCDPEPIPFPSAQDVLGRAGLPVEDHPRGEFFWARSEHGETLREWAKHMPINEVIARLSRAWQKGEIAQPHPMRLETFEKFLGITRG